MRDRAGVILIEESKVALIERFRAGTHYFVFPGGGVDAGETPEQAAIRETDEELGLRVAITRRVAEIQIGDSRQYYFLVERTGGKFGTGTGKEMSNLHPNDPDEGIHVPIWMPVNELPRHENIYPIDIVKLAVKSVKDGWPKETVLIVEEAK